MSGDGFGSLYYTDCLPGQGLRGGAGFQFQAVSPGVAHDTMALVQRTSLYEAPVAWMREQRAVCDYPPSLTHVFDGVYATARGVYLGAEANGVREGNQFTHAITTADPTAYGLTRPAQLWDAPWWAEKPAPSRECDPVAVEPETGPWRIDMIREWVLGRSDGEEWLLAVHSAFDQVHDSGGRRVLFVGDDASVVLGWIAAGTLLLPQVRALRVGFRVFATNPRQSQHDVLALHEDWAGQFGNPDRDNGFLVFNLVTGRYSTIEPTEEARHWVPRFLRADPYDVVDAIELAHQFARKREEDARPSAADRLVSGVVVLADRPDDPDKAGVLVEWLSVQPGLSTEDVVQPIVEAVLPFRLDVGVLRKLDAAMDAHGAERSLAARVRYALFAAEIEAVTGDRSMADEATSLAGLAEAAANGVSPELMDPLLRTVTRFGVEPSASGFRDGAHRFVQWWVDHPKEPIDPNRWSCGAQMIDQLRDELAQRLNGPNPQQVYDDIRRHWWKLVLATATDPSAPLDATAAAAGVEQGDPRTRRETIAYVFGAFRRAPLDNRGELIWRALFCYSKPTLDELSLFLRELPLGGLSDRLADETARILDGAIGPRPSAKALDALGLLMSHGGIVGRSRLADVAKQDDALTRWLASVSAGQPARPAMLRPVTEPVLAARTHEVIDALLRGMTLAKATEVVDRGSDDLPALLVRELPRIWGRHKGSGQEDTGAADTAVALAYLTALADSCSESLTLQFEKQLLRWLKSAEYQRVHRIGQLLRTVDEFSSEEWRQFARLKPAKTEQVKTGQTERAKRTRSSTKDTPREKGTGWPFGRRGRGK